MCSIFCSFYFFLNVVKFFMIVSQFYIEPFYIKAVDVVSTEVGSGERNEKPLELVALTSSTVVGEERKANADVPVPP